MIFISLSLRTEGEAISVWVNEIVSIALLSRNDGLVGKGNISFE